MHMIIGNCSCADPGIFVRGVQVSLTKKRSSDNVFFSPQLNLQKSISQFQEVHLFFKVPEGVQHFPGEGPTFSRGGGGVQLLIPIETHITCDFSGGGVRDPLSPPSGSALAALSVAVSVYFSATAI